MKFLRNLLTHGNIKFTCFILFIHFSISNLQAQQLAFPSAYGAGAYNSGGRGQTVYHVTTTDFNDNEGSFKWAFEQAVANNGGTIVFDVSGVITLIEDNNGSGEWRVDGTSANDTNTPTNISILGQTAPFPGITFDTSDTFWELNSIANIIIRYVKFRGDGNRGFINMRHSDKVLIDHCSFAWSSTGVTSLNLCSVSDFNIDGNDYTPSDITLQYSLMAHGGRASNTGNSSSDPNAKFGDVTFVRNVFHEMSYRTPLKSGGDGQRDIFNNIVSNIRSGKRQMRFDPQSVKINHFKNIYTSSENNILEGPIDGTDLQKIYTSRSEIYPALVEDISPEIYEFDNDYEASIKPMNYDNDPTTAWEPFQTSQMPNQSNIPNGWFVDMMHPLKGRAIPILETNQLKDSILPEVGACRYINDNGVVVYYRDVIDTRYVEDVLNDTNRDLENSNRPSGVEVDITSNVRPVNFYQSNLHIPEAYLVSRGIIGNATIHNEIQPSGYTLLEEYVNQVDNTAPIPVVDVTGVDVTPDTAEILIPETITLTATITPSNATDHSGIWESGDETIATVDTNGVVTPIAVGEVTITFTTNDGGYSDTSVITVFPEAFEANAGPDQTICQGESVVLLASGGTTYLWSNGETTASIEVSPTVTTTYTVTAFDDLGNSDDDTVTVTVNELPIAEAGNDQTICEGDTVTLSASGGDEYLWSTGETTASISVTPSSDVTYSVEVTSNGCSSTDDVSVFVNPLPNITVSNDVTIMDGETTTLTVSGSDNYLWSTGETTESIDVTPSLTTTYTVTSTSVNGCTSNGEVTVSVVPELIADAGEDVEICSGEETILTASGGVNYTWNTGETTAQITVSPNTTTTYTVTVEDGFGNSDSDSVTVTVNDSPTLTITEDLTIVEGESIQLTVSGASTYLWSTGETSDTILVTPNTTTTYTVIGTTATCSTEAQITVTVEELLVVSAGQDENVCENDSYEVVLTASSGDSYLWSTGETTQSITVSPLSTTTYSVTVTSGIQEDADDVTVFVNPNPNVVILNGESVDIMSGDFVTLSASGANTYEWNNGATQPNIAVSPSQTTTYEVRGYIGDCYDEKQVTVNVIPEVEADAGEDQEICLGDIVTLTATGGDGSEYEYEWSTGENTQSIQVSPTETTEYTVTVFSSLIDDFDEDTVTVFVNNNCNDGGVVEDPIDGTALEFEFSVYPNPATEYVDIKLSGSDQLTGVYLYDLTGKLIFQKRVENESLSVSSTTRIDVSSLRPGIYLVKLADVQRELYKRLIVR